jgi:hypothetical protein
MLWEITINLSGENHVYYRHGTRPEALNYARRKLMIDSGISYARTIGLDYEIREVSNV